MSTAEFPPQITKRAFAVVQELMIRDGLDSTDNEQVALYVERLIARERFFRTVEDIRQKTAVVADDELQQIIDEVVEEVEANHRGLSPGAAPAR